MGTTAAFSCDGPGCDALITREKGTRQPDEWIRVTLKMPGVDAKFSGSFHSTACLRAWITVQAADTVAELAPLAKEA